MASREPVVILARRAHAAGVIISRAPKGPLTLDIPPGADAIAADLHRCEQHLAALFDWRNAPVADPAPCLLCTRPALLRDPAERQPAHKVCVDTLLHHPAP
jgi:hypothetical protein